jgi:hypothetical protein
MTSFYIVPPRKTQLGDNGISISGTLGVITTNPGGAAITGVGALKLDTTYSPTWTGIHTFTQPIIFAGSQVINSTLISTAGQTAGDLFYYTGTSWSRLAVGSNNQVLQSFGGGIGWTGGVNLSNVITGNLKIGSLNGVLKASSGVVSGNSGIGDLSNVVLNLPASGNFLKYNGTNWVNSPIPLSDHNIIIRFLNGYTPVQTGIDIEIALVPYEPSDGTTVLEYTITRIIFQVEVAGSTSSQITIERALLGQEFDNPMTLGNTIETLSLGAGVYTVSSTGPFFKIYSGERLRLNINLIGTGAQQWTVQVEGTAGNPYNGTNAGITSINSLAAQLQNMVVGSGGTDFNISSVIDTHTFNIPSASGTNRGLVTTGNQTFAGVKTFNNPSASISTTSGAIIVNGGVGIGETLNVGGNVVVGNNLILNNPMPIQSGGTGITALGSANSLLSVNNTASALEYKNLIAGAGISINFSSSNITIDVTGSANTGNIGFNNDVIYNTLNNTIYISPSDQYAGYSYIAVPNDNDASVSPLAIANLVGSIQITSGTSISNSYIWTFNSDGTLSSPYYTFPNNDGLTGQALITDGAGNLSWGNVSATGSGGGISSLNGISYINYPVQNFAIGSAGTNFNIVSIGSTHTFNFPEAGSGSSGIVTTGSQAFSGIKSFANNLIAQSDINVSGSSNLLSAVGVSSSLNVAGGLGVTGATILRSTLQVQGVATIINNTNASSSTSGSLVVTGGVGVSGALYVGSGANINSNNISGTLTNSGLVFSGNSLTTGTGFYVASSSLTTGKLIDVVVSGNAATGARTGINVSIGGSNASTGVTTYGVFVNNTSTNGGNNIGLASFASGVTNNIPLRIGLNTSKYINLFINSDGNGLTLSPTSGGTPFLALGGYAGTTAELRLLQSGGFGAPPYVALKAPNTVTNAYELIFPNSYPSSSSMALVGTGTTQVTLSWSSLGAGGIGGTINAGDQYKLAFYVNPNGSSVLDDAQALNYSTSGANLTINSTAASVVPLKLVGAVSQTADLFQVATSSGNIFTIDKDGLSTFTNNLVVSSTTASTSSSTGALTVAGGLGVQGRVNIGTGLSVASTANFASSVEINTLRLLNALTLNYGGTGLGTSGLPNQILGMNSTSSSLEYKTINAGFGISISNSSNLITLSVTSSGSGISSINGLTSAEQTFATSSSGTNFNIVSIGSTHTFNIPPAGSGSSGIITTAAQTISGDKSFTDVIVASGLGVSNTATFRSTVDIYSGLGVTGSTTLRNTLSVSGVSTFSNTTNSNATSNGAIVVSGGVGVGGTVYTNNLYVLGTTTLFNPLSVTNGGTGSNNGSITGTGALTFTAGGTNTNINLVPNGTGTVDVSGKRITNLATPTGALDAVTKVYVDQIAQGINYHDHVEASTTAGLGATYQNGVNGIGATLQASPAAGWSTSLADGVLLTVGDRFLVKNQSGAGVTIQNGIYILTQTTSPWILTRSSDYDNSIAGSVAPGDTVWVAFGNTLQYTTWTQSTFGTGDSSGGILIGTDPIGYIQITGAGSYSGDGNTISITGSIISIASGYVGQSTLTTLGTIASGSWNASVINVLYGGTGASSFTSNGALYGNGSSAIQATAASSQVGAILTTAASGGAPAFSNTLQGQYIISNNTNSTSSTSGALSITGGLGVSGNIFAGSNININNAVNIGSGLGVSGNTNITGGLGITGSSLFRSSVVIQSGGIGVTGGIVVTQGGLGVTGATVLNSSLTVAASTILNSTLNAIGNVNFATVLNVGGTASLAGVGISGNLDVVGGLGISGKTLFRDSAIIQSGGLGVTGGIVVSSGGLGVTGATTLRSTLSVLGTASFATINQGTWNGSAIGLSYGGTGLGTSGTANQMLGMSNDSSGLEYKTLIAGSNVTILNSTNSITISSSSGGGGGSGIVNTGLATQVAYYAVGGTSVSGTSNLTVGSSGVGISFATQSTSSTSGALVVSGGIGVSGNVRIGSGLGVSGTLNFVSGTFGNVGSSTFTLNFLSSGNSPISLNVLSDNSLSFEGSSGQLLAISNNLSTGFIYSINNISGLPLLRANANGNVSMGEFTGNIGVGTSTPQFKLHVIGDTNVTGGFGVSGLANVSGGLGVTGYTNLSSTLIVQGNAGIVGGLGVTGSSLFRSSVIVQSGGLGVSGGIVITQGGLGVTGATVLRSTLSVLGTASFATINQGTWNGSAIGLTYGGTGLGSSGTANQFLGMSNDSTSLEYKTLIAGSNVTILNSTNSITISAASGGGSGIVNSGLITQVAYYAVGGTSVSGTSNLTIGSSGVGISFNAQSTSSSTGALIVLGGLGVSGNVNVGTGLTVLGTVHLASNINSTSSTTGAVIVTGGIGVSGRIWAGSGISSQGGGTFTGALSASSLTLSSALSISSGGTGLGISGVSNQMLGMNIGSTSLEYKTLIAGSNISIVHGSGTVTLNAIGTGISSLNGLTNTTQVFTTGYSGTDFNIVSIGSTHTFNIPVAGSGSSGIITTGAQTIAGTKVFTGGIIVQSVGLGVTGGIVVTQGGLGVTGATVLNSSLTVATSTILNSTLNVVGNINFALDANIGGATNISGLGVSNNINITGGLGISGNSLFRSSVIIQSGGLGVTGGIVISQGGLGVTGPTVLNSSLTVVTNAILNSTLNVLGNTNLASSLNVGGASNVSGLGVSANINITGGLGISGTSIFRSSVIIQSGGLGVTGGIVISQGGLGVTGAAIFNSSISAGSLSLSTALPLSSGGTGLGSTSLANYILGMNNSSLGLEYKQIVEGSNITITHNTNSITIAAASSSSTPGGPNSAIQYNGSNTLAGTSAFLWDNASQRIDIKNTNAIGTGTTTGFLLQNSTASTVSVQMQFSPGIEFAGRAWKTSGSPATDTFVRYLQMVEVTSGGTPTGAITWKSAIHNASNQGPTYVKRAEISTNYGFGIYETNGVYKSSIINSASATTDIYYTLPAALPSLNQALTVTGISVSSVTLSWISNGTVASGASGALAYYSGTGTTVDDATGLAYASSGTHLIITSQNATDVPLRVDGHASSSVNLFQVRKGTSDQLVINSSGNVSILSSEASTGSTSGALIVTGGVGIGGTLNVGANLSISGLTTLTYTSEKLNTKTSATGTVTHDLSSGSIFYHSSISSNFTANFTNVPTTNDRAVGVTLILAQGVTPYMSTALQIDGSAQTIKWVNNTTPTGTASKVDIVGFSFIRTGSAWTVLGQYSTYG